MSIKIIKPRQRIETVSYMLNFDRISHPGSGCSFPCDAAGTVDVAALAPPALRNYQEAQGSADYHPAYVETRRHRYSEAAVGKCHCGREVDLSDALDNGCDCGRWYNMAGQEVTPSHLCDARGEPIYREDY